MSVLRAIIVAACPDMGPPKFPFPSESQQRGMQALPCVVNGCDTQSLLDGLIPTRPGNETTTGNAVATKQVLVAVVYVLYAYIFPALNPAGGVCPLLSEHPPLA